MDDIFKVFPEARNHMEKLPLKGQPFRLLHDNGVSYSGRRLHLKLAPVKEIGSATRKAMAYYDEFQDLDNGSQYIGPACSYITDLRIGLP